MDRNMLQTEIARLAYDLYERRGRSHGYDLEDWVKAEQIVLKRHAGEIEREAEVIKTAKVKLPAEKKTKALKTSVKSEKTAKTTEKKTTRKKKTE